MVEYSTRSKTIKFFVDVYYFNRIRDQVNIVFLLRKDINNVPTIRKARIIYCKNLPSNDEIINKLRRVYFLLIDKLNEMNEWVKVNKFASPYYRFLALSGIIPQRFIGNLINVDTKYTQYKILHSILKELKLDEIENVYESKKIFWRLMYLKQEGDEVLFLEGIDKHLDKVYSRLYKIDEGFREATEELLTI